MALTTEPVTRTLPIADMASVRRHTRQLLREHRGTMTKVIGLHALAALASLVAPRLVGALVDGVTNGTTRSHINTLVTWIAVSVRYRPSWCGPRGGRPSSWARQSSPSCVSSSSRG